MGFGDVILQSNDIKFVNNKAIIIKLFGSFKILNKNINQTNDDIKHLQDILLRKKFQNTYTAPSHHTFLSFQNIRWDSSTIGNDKMFKKFCNIILKQKFV